MIIAGRRVLEPVRGRVWSAGRDMIVVVRDRDGVHQYVHRGVVRLADCEPVDRCRWCGDWRWHRECAVCGRS